MAFDPITAGLDLVSGIGGKLIDKLIPDANAANAAKAKLLEMRLNGELAQVAAETDLLKGQQQINQVEAGSASLFVSGWRPMVGWACALGVTTQFLVAPIATYLAALGGKVLVFPTLDMGTLIPLLLGMLGIAGMRTAEKISRVSK